MLVGAAVVETGFMVFDGSDVYSQLPVMLPDAALDGGRVEYVALGPQSHQLIGENHDAPLIEQSGSKLEEVAVAEVTLVEMAVAEVGLAEI